MKRVERSSRDSRVAEWLRNMRNPAVNGLALQLEQSDDEPEEIVQTWDCPEGTTKPWCEHFEPAAVAAEVCSLLDNLADETKQPVSARLIWTVDGRPFTRFPVRAEAPDTGVSGQKFEPSTKSALIQTQRHQEAMAQQYFKATQCAIEAADRVCDRMATAFERREDRLADLELRAAQLADENVSLRAQLAELEGVAERAVEQGEEAAEELERSQQNRAEEGQLSQIVQIGLKQAMGAAQKKGSSNNAG